MLNKNQIQQAIWRLENNEVVIIPTDTIYGLSAKLSQTNCKKINALKCADENKLNIILISNFEQALELGVNKEDLKYFDEIHSTIIFDVSNNKRLAIRKIYKEDIVQIIESVGPIFSTSVNKHGSPFLTKEQDLSNFSKGVSLFFDKEFNPAKKPSKIFSIKNNSYIR